MRKFLKTVDAPDGVILPTRATKNSAGYDFHSLDKISLFPGQRYVFKTYVKAAMEPDEVLCIVPRSSMGIKRGLTLVNSIGVIDSDYFSNKDNDGNISIVYRNDSEYQVEIAVGERIAQGIFTKYLVTDDDNATAPRTGGIGSTN